MSTNSARDTLVIMLRALKLSAWVNSHEEVAQKAVQQGWSYGQFLQHLCELEVQERQHRRLGRLLKESGLPSEKTLATLERLRLPSKVQKRLPSLCEGGFLAKAENILCFGLPGRGKTHLCCAVGHELVRQGHRVLFVPTYKLVQRLLCAKRDLTLERELSALDAYEVVILDDIGYVQQDREEMEVLFTFLAQRYERKSVMITSNVVFSQWDRIFKDPMTTAAAIDRLVHHAIIVEMTGESYRSEAAKQRGEASS